MLGGAGQGHRPAHWRESRAETGPQERGWLGVWSRGGGAGTDEAQDTRGTAKTLGCPPCLAPLGAFLSLEADGQTCVRSAAPRCSAARPGAGLRRRWAPRLACGDALRTSGPIGSVPAPPRAFPQVRFEPADSSPARARTLLKAT